MGERFQRRAQRTVRITEGDLEIVRAIFEARYLTTAMICRLFFKPTTRSWCKSRLRGLFDRGYLRKRKVHVNQPDVYFLGLQGRRHIAATDGRFGEAEVRRIAGVSGDGREAPSLMMRHELTLSRLYVNARLETARHALQMRWLNTRMLELMNLGVEPDAFLAIGRGCRERAAFIEFTAEPPKTDEMQRKMQAYENYLESRRCQVDFGLPSVAILWFITSRNRLERARRDVIGYTYRDYLLLALIEDAGRYITEPIWWWSESKELIAWARPSFRTADALGGRIQARHSQLR